MLLIYQAIYLANILIAGTVGALSLFAPTQAKTAVFQNAFAESEAFRITGAFWLAITLLSLAGLFFPEKFLLVFFIQLIYKGLWLLFGALPKLLQKRYSEIPIAMAIFFLVYVCFLPFIIPFKSFFR